MQAMDEKLWQDFNAILKGRIKEIHFTTWHQQAKPISINNQGFRVAVPNRFVRDWIQENFLTELEACLQELKWDGAPIEIEVDETLDAKAPAPATDHPPRRTTPPSSSLNIPGTLLNPRYTFENFVVGSSNQFAHAACRAVAASPAQNYNPLFLYGGVGLGKTHLLNAIGQEIRKNSPEVRISYISSEQFMNKLVHSIRFDQMNQFRQTFRDSCDLLLIDDIQFIAGKERTQEEFFHTFDRLYNSQKQIVITSDRSPNDISKLEERLRSRFQWGLIADIQLPEMETRVAIIKKKAEAAHVNLPDEVALFLASTIKSNIRELEGSLVRLSAFASLLGQPITIQLAQEVLTSLIKDLADRLTIGQVQKVVAEFYQLRLADLLGKRRTRALAFPRQIAMYLCRKHIQASFPEIGHKFGGKDHSTVVHAVSKIRGCLEEDGELRRQLQTIESRLNL